MIGKSYFGAAVQGEEEEGEEEGKKEDHLLQVLLVVIPRVFKGNNVFSPLFDDE